MPAWLRLQSTTAELSSQSSSEQPTSYLPISFYMLHFVKETTQVDLTCLHVHCTRLQPPLFSTCRRQERLAISRLTQYLWNTHPNGTSQLEADELNSGMFRMVSSPQHGTDIKNGQHLPNSGIRTATSTPLISFLVITWSPPALHCYWVSSESFSNHARPQPSCKH